MAYYTGIGASGEPALMRCRATDTSGVCVEEELVEGVENMQLTYGLSLESNDRPTGYIQTARIASAIGDASTNLAAREQWRLVGAIQVGVLVRSPNRSQALNRAAPYSSLGLDITPPAGDQRTRAVYENTVALRNRLFGN
jgi:type IV pilus assembly protein PilW